MSTPKFFKAPTLRAEEEAEILGFLLSRAAKGEDVTRQDIIDMVARFLQSGLRKNPFRNGIPGDKWFSLFRRRHYAEFKTLDPDALEKVELIGFTEKVTNTVVYGKPGQPPIQRDRPYAHGPNGQRKKKRKKRLVLASTKPKVKAAPMSTSQVSTPRRSASSTPQASPGTDSECDEDMAQDSQDTQTDSTDFQIGSRLEVMDFNEKWYPVKVVEVDYEEGEVLVHFEKWSDKYDEWVRMDSNRIRRPKSAPMPTCKKIFEKGEKVLAVWAYNLKYPATIKNVLPGDKYEVLFCDGYAKILRGCKLFKASKEELQNCQMPPPKKPAPPMGADPLDPNLGPKEERRLKKRRIDVFEAFIPQKKQKLDSSTPESSPQPPSSGLRIKLGFLTKNKDTSTVKINKELDSQDEEDEDFDDETKWLKDEADDQEDEDEDEENDHVEMKQETDEETEMTEMRETKEVKKKKSPAKKVRAEGDMLPRIRGSQSDNTDRWDTEIPEGAKPVRIKDVEGRFRESIIVPDKRIPVGWTKHTMPRRSGGKWDVFLVNSDGRKFRSRNELRLYFAELKQVFPEESFDFMVGRSTELMKIKIKQKKKLKQGFTLVSKTPSSQSKNSSGSFKSEREGRTESEKVTREEYSYKVKTLLPRGRGEIQCPVSPGPAQATTPHFPLADMRTPDGGFTCCGKNFRKENLYQMHMKHYHPEYSKLFSSTPNVADLAYARTVGEPLEDSRAEAMTPRSTFIDRVNKYEAERRAGDKSAQETKPASASTKTSEDHNTSEESETSSGKSLTEEKLKLDETPKSNQENESSESASHSTKSTEFSEVTALPESPVDEKAEVPKESQGGLLSKTVSDTLKKSQPSSTSTTESSAVPSIPAETAQKQGSKEKQNISKKTEGLSALTPAPTKAPITISKYVPPGQKAPSVTKVTISLTSTTEKTSDTKPTIKTLLPMRPPPVAETKETQDVQKPKETTKVPKDLQKIKDVPKPKEIKPKEELKEEEIMPTKSKRKRTASETLQKKPKLLKPSTGSLEEEPASHAEAAVEKKPSSTTNEKVKPTSHRFSRNRTPTQPRVAQEKLSVTPDNKELESSVEESCEAPATPIAPTSPEAIYENLRKEEIINCTCGYAEEDGLMIQCDLCLCWQHGLCNSIVKETDVPEKYVCSICLNPARQRDSQRFVHNQDWMKEGILPSLSFREKNEEIMAQRQSVLKKSHDLSGSLIQLQTVIQSLRVKTHIATKPDHPKLYLWAKSWKNEATDPKIDVTSPNKQDVCGPQPEAAIDETECRLRLLEHIEDYQQQADDRLTSIQAQIAALESEDPDLASDEASDHYPVTKQTVQMILRDLGTVQQVAAIN